MYKLLHRMILYVASFLEIVTEWPATNKIAYKILQPGIYQDLQIF